MVRAWRWGEPMIDVGVHGHGGGCGHGWITVGEGMDGGWDHMLDRIGGDSWTECRVCGQSGSWLCGLVVVACLRVVGGCEGAWSTLQECR